MRTRLYLCLCAALLICPTFIVGCAKDKKEEHLCGAYTEQRQITREEMKMFMEVISKNKDQNLLYMPITVATQVVAGINYRFYCKVDSFNTGSNTCYVIIYKPLKGKPELTEIEEANDTLMFNKRAVPTNKTR